MWNYCDDMKKLLYEKLGVYSDNMYLEANDIFDEMISIDFLICEMKCSWWAFLMKFYMYWWMIVII
jgi:hypothetical protein